jgi:exodeoxyribonuclease V
MWSPQQEKALKAVDRWFYQESKKKQVYRIYGYAGVGKTTLAIHFAQNIDGHVLFAAFTGKAASVMRNKGCVGARTIHSLIYIAEQNKTTGEITWALNRQSDLKDAALLIIDECSMVNEELARDLLSFGTPILVLGDPAQLPPVSGAGYFTEAEPDVMLTEIHRQARDNPIIHLASMIREGEFPDVGAYGDSRVVNKISSRDAVEADQVIVGRNATRDTMNQKIRKLFGHSDEFPEVNEKLICLKNDRDLGIYNGVMFRVEQNLQKKFKTNFLHMRLQEEDSYAVPVIAKVHKSFFSPEYAKPDWKTLKGSQEFDLGWAITCHKSQGSQWKNVLIQDESWCFRDSRWKWLYTACTRASDRITLLCG